MSTTNPTMIKGIYVPNLLYPTSDHTDPLRASGFTNATLWNAHVSDNGDIFNVGHERENLIVDGAYVGNSAWPAELSKLKSGTTSVNRIFLSFGPSNETYANIKKVMRFVLEAEQNQAIGYESPLLKNLKALKAAVPAIDGIDLDYEPSGTFDNDLVVEFSLLVGQAGFKITFCPYQDQSNWVTCLQRIYDVDTNLVVGFNLQCYDGWGGNDPNAWAAAIKKAIPSFDVTGYVTPGVSSLYGSNCDEGKSPAKAQSKLAGWKSADTINGFIWNAYQIGKCEPKKPEATFKAYAEAIENAFS